MDNKDLARSLIEGTDKDFKKKHPRLANAGVSKAWPDFTAEDYDRAERFLSKVWDKNVTDVLSKEDQELVVKSMGEDPENVDTVLGTTVGDLVQDLGDFTNGQEVKSSEDAEEINHVVKLLGSITG